MTMRRAFAVFTVFLFSLILPCIRAEGPPGAPANGQQAFVDQYIDHLLYMVYINDKIKVPAGDDYLYRKAISAANDFLASKSMEVVLLDQVEKLKRDHTTLVEDVEGENMSVVQWLAQKLNADVYIVIDVMVNSEKRGNRYYAQTTLTLTVFEAATGRLLGSKSASQLDRSLGTSEELAKMNSVGISVTRIMDDVITLAKSTMRKAVETGIRFELYLVGTQDAKTVLSFINRLKGAGEKVGEIQSVYRTDTEGKYYVFFFGAPEAFELLVYETAGAIPGFEALKLVSQRGKSYTFSTGL